MVAASDQNEAVNKAFSKQAAHFNADDLANPILQAWRHHVYDHVNQFLKPGSFMLELNAGTGIDAEYFVAQGHQVHATDLSDGMIRQLEHKISNLALQGKLSCQQCSFENLDLITGKKFDYIFSNFGGLNCVDDLKKVTKHFPALLFPGGFATLVVMPPISLWEWLWVFKGNIKTAFRRLDKNGTITHLEGEHFTTYYHSLSKIKSALGSKFKLIKCESLGTLSPPPASTNFIKRFPVIFNMLRQLDSRLRLLFPFNRCGDHIIVTFQFT